MIKMIYFSFGAFTTLVVRGHRRTKLRGHRRQAERERDQYEEKARKRERRREAMGQSQDSSCLCSRQMSTHLITTPGGSRATHNSLQCHVYYLYIHPRQQELSSIHWQVVEYCNTVTVRNRKEEKQKTMPVEERGPVTLGKGPPKVRRHLESV